jgi:hypothetical protein
MTRMRGLVCLVVAIACAACGTTTAHPATPAPATSSSSSLKVVTYTPAPGQPVPSSLAYTKSMQFSVTVRSGYACFAGGGFGALVWPAGYSARVAGNGRAEVRDASGGVVVRVGAEYEFDAMTVASPGDACSSEGQNVTAILTVTTPTEKGWVPLEPGG